MRISTRIIGSAAALMLLGAGLTGGRPVEAAGAPPVLAIEQASAPAAGFSGGVVYSKDGFAMTVYSGSIVELEAAAGAAGATGVWVQDVSGRFQLLPVRGPVFLQSGFEAAFPAAPGSVAFPQMTAVTLVR